MIQRKIMGSLLQWKERDDRKPLVLRGARQVGKTTPVMEFGKLFDVFLPLNLEKTTDRNMFERYEEVNELLKAIFLHKKKKINGGSVLL